MGNVIDFWLENINSTFWTLVFFGVIFYASKLFLDRQAAGKSDWGLIRSIVLFLIGITGAIAIILSLPMQPETKGQITSLLGIVISAVLALSSATLIGNGLAGIMLRMINSFKPGDFIKINDHFGRVTERGLFHTEMQTENRDLLTLPNMYLTTNPVRVTRSNGTFVSAECSLGYDVSRTKIEEALLEAAKRAGLTDAFVRITSLGDFSVVYKVYGLIKEIKTVLTATSRLHGHMLDALHEADIEIVSPNFMNQRPVGETVFIPKRHTVVDNSADTPAPESLIFDKAEVAEKIEKRKESLTDLEEKITDLTSQLKEAEGDEAKEAIKAKIEKWTEIKTKMKERLDQSHNDLAD